jgi:ribonucleoside-diphosphate reductase alpha chain
MRSLPAVETETIAVEETILEPTPLPGEAKSGAVQTSAQAADDGMRIAEARMKGYVGEACPECGNFTLVRNGTCLKCDTCGGTTGCS